MIRAVYDDRLSFGPEAILSLACKQSIDPIFGGLPEAELQLELYTAQALSVETEQKLQIFWKDRLFATGHIIECIRQGKKHYRLRAKPRLQYLQTEFYGCVYRGKSLTGILQELLPDRVPERDDFVLEDENIWGYIPPGTRGKALQQLVCGQRLFLRIAENGKLLLCNPSGYEPETLSPARLQIDEMQLLPAYTRYEVCTHRYTPGKLYKTVMDDQEYAPGMLTLTFSRPYWMYSIDENEQAWIRQESSNHILVEQNGLVSLEAIPYIHETAFQTLQGDGGADPDFSHVMTLRDMTMIPPERAAEQLKRMQEYGQLRCRVTARYCPDSEPPRAGHRVRMEAPSGQVLEGVITKEKTTFAAGQLQTELTVLTKEVT